MSGGRAMSFLDALERLRLARAAAAAAGALPLEDEEPEDDAERWLSDFAERPLEILDDLLRGYDQISPYERAEPAEALAQIFQDQTTADARHRLDQTMADWLAARMREPAPADDQRNASVLYLRRALAIIRRLRLMSAGRMLAERFLEASAWAEAVSPPEFFDLRGELWLTLAHVQPDRHLLSFWYGLCDQVGLEMANERALDTALLALRALPQTEGDIQPGPELLRGLARWARNRPNTAEDKDRFLTEWRALVALYPDIESDVWRDRVAPLLDGYSGKPFATWWAEDVGAKQGGGKRSTHSARKPGQDDTESFLKRMFSLPTAKLPSAVDEFALLYEQYTDETADTYFLPRAFNRVGNALLKRDEQNSATRHHHARLALRLAGAAVSRDRNNEPSWTLWAKALEQLGHADLAETVLWEATRTFSENPYMRCELAALLIPQNRLAEAEALYCNTMTRFLDNEVSRTALARLWADHGRPAEAEALYRQTMASFPDDAVCRLDLGLMLLDLGRPLAEIELLLEELRALRATEADTLADRLNAVRQGQSRRTREAPLILPAAPLAIEDTAWNDLRQSAEAMRAGFCLSSALDHPRLLLVSAEMQQELRAEAQAALTKLQETHPHHPVVRLVARRWGGKALADEITPQEGDYPLRLELARTGRSDDFPRLLNNKHFKLYRPMTALAWLLADDPQAEGAATELVDWLPRAPEKDPLLHALHTRLSKIIPIGRLRQMSAVEFLEIWDEKRGKAVKSLNAVLDLAVLGLVAREPPLAALNWMPELEAA